MGTGSHNQNNHRAKDLFDYLTKDAEKNALAISRFAYEFSLEAHRARRQAEEELKAA